MVIPAGKTVMLDVNTPVLKMLLIQGMQQRLLYIFDVSSFVSNQKCCDLICFKLLNIMGRHCFQLLKYL